MRLEHVWSTDFQIHTKVIICVAPVTVMKYKPISSLMETMCLQAG